MAWVVQCPTHGAVIEDYHFEALRKLELHSKKTCDIKKDSAFLFELKEQEMWEKREEKLLDSLELVDN